MPGNRRRIRRALRLCHHHPSQPTGDASQHVGDCRVITASISGTSRKIHVALLPLPLSEQFRQQGHERGLQKGRQESRMEGLL